MTDQVLRGAADILATEIPHQTFVAVIVAPRINERNKVGTLQDPRQPACPIETWTVDAVQAAEGLGGVRARLGQPFWAPTSTATISLRTFASRLRLVSVLTVARPTSLP